MTNPLREDIVKEIAEVIDNIKLPHPVRVAIDGGGNAGKTTFANELANELIKLNRNIIRSTIDGFHNPPEIRRKQGKYSPKGYFEDSYNYPVLKKYLLEPLGPDGNLIYKNSYYDFKINKKTNSRFKKASQDSILIFDGIFLYKPELINYWDYKLYIDASFYETLKRALVRDKDLFGGEEKVIKLYKRRYIPGQKMYLAMRNPLIASDIVINNNDYRNPIITRISNHRLHNNLNHIRNSLSYSSHNKK